MSVRAWRLAFKMQRLELLIFVAAAVALVAASLLIARGASEARASFDACFQAAGSDAGCAACRQCWRRSCCAPPPGAVP